MPSPISSNKYTQQLENNLALRNKMREAFVQADAALSNFPLGGLDGFTVEIDGISMRYRRDDQILIFDLTFNDCSATLKTQAYARLERFMQIALARYNTQYNL
jgi:hypothetical protein